MNETNFVDFVKNNIGFELSPWQLNLVESLKNPDKKFVYSSGKGSMKWRLSLAMLRDCWENGLTTTMLGGKVSSLNRPILIVDELLDTEPPNTALADADKHRAANANR